MHFLDKEPDTIEWINGFQKGETLLDVGANIGVFSLYAGLRGHKVVAVEPESQNYSLLNQNIFLNKLDEKVEAFNIALSDKNGATSLYLSEFAPGMALHAVGCAEDYRPSGFSQRVPAGDYKLEIGRFYRFPQRIHSSTYQD